MIPLHEAIAALGHPTVMALVVSDGVDDDDWPENPIATLGRDEWPGYQVEEISRLGGHSVTYASPTAVERHPGHRNVRIRVEFLYVFKGRP
jgi:hypothetical protein